MRNHALGVVSVVVTLVAVSIAAIAVWPGWETVKEAAHVRRLALGLDRTAHYRAFAAYMGLSAGWTRSDPAGPVLGCGPRPALQYVG